ncbi:hypothetical protein DIPPA_10992 [Diplonema papillatum]|nr:hypothetical protein DIPPA_10992 [Diplonema papillatum]
MGGPRKGDGGGRRGGGGGGRKGSRGGGGGGVVGGRGGHSDHRSNRDAHVNGGRDRGDEWAEDDRGSAEQKRPYRKTDERERKEREREREWARERDRDRARYPVEVRGKNDIWDRQPTFSRINELEDGRSLDELERILTAAEDKLYEMQGQLENDEQLVEEQKKRQETLQLELDSYVAEKDAKAEDLEAARAAAQQCRDLSTAIADKIKVIKEEKQALAAEKKAKQRELGFGSQCPTEEEATKAIRKVESEMETCRSLSPKVERGFLAKIKKLETIRGTLRQLRKYTTVFEQKEAEIKLCEEEIKRIEEERDTHYKTELSVKEEIARISKKVASTKRSLQQSTHRDLVASEKRQGVFVELMTHKVGYRAAKGRYEEALAEWEAEKKDAMSHREEDHRRFLEERENLSASRQKARDEKREQHKANPWAAEREACNCVIGHLTDLLHENPDANGNGDGERRDERRIQHDDRIVAAFREVELPFPHYPSEIAEHLRLAEERKDWLQTAAWDDSMPRLASERRRTRGGKGGKGSKRREGGGGGGGKSGYRGGGKGGGKGGARASEQPEAAAVDDW